MKDIFGQALFDYFKAGGKHKLWINNTYGPKEEMPLNVYFRTEEEMPDLELIALNKCSGKVLDIGAGAGSHALLLQDKGLEVTAIDISGLAVTVMQQRGVKDAARADIFTYSAHDKYDTLLLMMNGIGLCGTIEKLRLFLRHAKTLLNKGGQLLFDSSDIAYLYEGSLPRGTYYGELSYQYTYKGQETEWFKWLYIDQEKLRNVALQEGWVTQILYEDDIDQYLAKLNPVN